MASNAAIMFANLDPNTLDDLRLSNVLDKKGEAPRFGHSTRRDAARSFLETDHREAIRSEAQYLILALGRAIAPDPSAIFGGALNDIFCEALRGLRDTAEQYDLGSLPLALCGAAETLLGERPSMLGWVVEGAQHEVDPENETVG